jgi:hypothetical protein
MHASEGRTLRAFRAFELQAIHLMADGVLSDEQLRALGEIECATGYEYTGCGYFLQVHLPSLPVARRTLSTPGVVGRAGDVQAGFLVFLGEQALTLECHTWGQVDVPPDFRDRDVSIAALPDTTDHRATPRSVTDPAGSERT